MGVVGPLDVAPAAVKMQLPARAVSIAVGVVVLIAGTRQFIA